MQQREKEEEEEEETCLLDRKARAPAVATALPQALADRRPSNSAPAHAPLCARCMHGKRACMLP